MKKLFSYTALFMGLLLFLLHACQSQKEEWMGEIHKENGVTVVLNPKTPLYEGDVFHLDEDLVIGEREGPEEYMFSEASDISVSGRSTDTTTSSGGITASMRSGS